MTMHIYVAVIEVKPLSGCEIDPVEYNGASVRCYIPGEDEVQARTSLAVALKDGKFELVEEEFFVQEDLVEWENPNSKEASAAISEAKISGQVIFTEFHGWGHDDPDAS